MDKETEVRETDMGRVLNKFSSASSFLLEEVSAIESRLEGVINGGGVKQGAETGDKLVSPEFNTTLAQNINKFVMEVESAGSRLNRLRSRIEL